MRGLAVIAYFLCAGLVVLAACGADEMQPGVVATVDGRSITLQQVEQGHDVRFLARPQVGTPAVKELRKEYGQVLSELIIQELVADELERRGMSVGDEELKAAEQAVRADYPEGGFEQLMAEEYLDLDFWRQQLKARLAWERFLGGVLRPQVVLESAELENYYSAHRREFRLPPRVLLVLLHSEDRSDLEKALENRRASNAPAPMPNSVTEQKLILDADRVPAVWLDAMHDLREGEASAPLVTDNGYLSLVLEGRLPAEDMALDKAYEIIEEKLVTPRLQAAFDAWLANRLVTADIRVSEQLLRSVPADDGDEPSMLEPAPPAEVEQPAQPLPDIPLESGPPDPELDALEKQ